MSWRKELPSKLKNSLQSLLRSVDRHEDVYTQAENVSIGQIWVAMAVMNRRLEKIEKMARAQRKALQEIEADVDVDKHLSENLEESLKKY
ncbi:hypothetical protein GKQ38_04035 [Candidatus Nanohaloarchaea archaeon]|nr:hypothetical protein GKQ38_04035 [Candidatus Nanohaloarchaea archaeon]